MDRLAQRIIDHSPVVKLAHDDRSLVIGTWVRNTILSITVPLRGHWILLAVAFGSLIWMANSGSHAIQGLGLMAAITVASLVSSIAGFAFAAIAGAALFHFIDDAVELVQIVIVCSIANQAAMTWAARADIVWRELLPYLTGGAAGLGIGAWILLHIDRAFYIQAFGIFLLAYGAWMLVRPPIVLKAAPIAGDVISGFLGGITGGAAGFPSAFVSIWCGMKGWDKRRQRAISQPFILVMQVAALLLISILRWSGASGGGFAMLDLLFVPASLLGTAAGLIFYRRLTDKQFARVVNLLLVASGVSFIW